MPQPPLAKLANDPFSVETFLEMDFYDGALSGFFRSTALSVVTKTSSDFVFGPARTDWCGELGYHWRTFLMSPVADGVCRQVLDDMAKRLSEPVHAGEFYYGDHHTFLAPALSALVMPFTHDNPDPHHFIQGRYLCKSARVSSRSTLGNWLALTQSRRRSSPSGGPFDRTINAPRN
ncbi:MAG: hypothetical protein ACREJD_04970 [Phycisphaerales bacterium]